MNGGCKYFHGNSFVVESLIGVVGNNFILHLELLHLHLEGMLLEGM
jgi:hypothetical protein